uniref:(northern house mosquito) hypothetical protein n=1 Tax=Culex pipiens TaxID=7175 RepID=A0A8D8GGK9_CULPI
MVTTFLVRNVVAEGVCQGGQMHLPLRINLPVQQLRQLLVALAVRRLQHSDLGVRDKVSDHAVVLDVPAGVHLHVQHVAVPLVPHDVDQVEQPDDALAEGFAVVRLIVNGPNVAVRTVASRALQVQVVNF